MSGLGGMHFKLSMVPLRLRLPLLPPRQHLLLTALAASLGIAALFSGYSLFVLERRSGIKDGNSRVMPCAVSWRPRRTHLPALGALCRIRRNYAFFGQESMARICKARVVVVGCGGVGSWAAVMLVCFGVSHIRDTLVARTLRDVARWVEVDARVDIWRKDEGGGTLLEGADFVIDAIDNIQTKVDLLHYCHAHKIPVFSSMGAGAKTDPMRIQIADISDTVYDPLARAVRRRLRLLGVSSGIPVVYLAGDVKLLPLPEDEFAKGKVEELGVMDDWRVCVLPVLGPLPALFGLNASVKNRRKVYERMLRDLQAREPEGRRAGGEPGMVTRSPIDEDDIAVVIPPQSVPVRPTLVRWNLSEGLTLENVVVMEQKEARSTRRGVYGYVEDTKMQSCLDLWGAETDALVQKRREEARRVTEWVDW
ncbi:ubiquitin-protein ligase molybdopterin-converting factor [Mycena amicta]|nr:ubiquitin-protein ligase molybdopterin-converting factor [Mycena amicta]